MLTAGSRGIRTTWPYVQQAGASARARLIQAAAAKWNVPASGMRSAQTARCIHKASGRSLRYGELVKDAAKVKLAAEPAIKTAGTIQAGGHAPAAAGFRHQIHRQGANSASIRAKPGQLYASIMSCPVFGGKLVSVDDSAIKGARGIKQVVKLDDAVAVVADNYWRANEALEEAEDHLGWRRRGQDRQRPVRQGISRRAGRADGDGAQ